MIQFMWLYQVQYHIKISCSNGMREQRFILWILSRDYSSPYIHFLWTQLSSTIHQFNPEQNKNLLMNIVYFIELSMKKRKIQQFLVFITKTADHSMCTLQCITLQRQNIGNRAVWCICSASQIPASPRCTHPFSSLDTCMGLLTLGFQNRKKDILHYLWKSHV